MDLIKELLAEQSSEMIMTEEYDSDADYWVTHELGHENFDPHEFCIDATRSAREVSKYIREAENENNFIMIAVKHGKIEHHHGTSEIDGPLHTAFYKHKDRQLFTEIHSNVKLSLPEIEKELVELQNQDYAFEVYKWSSEDESY